MVCYTTWDQYIPWDDLGPGGCVAVIWHSWVPGAVAYEINGSADRLACPSVTPVLCYVYFASFEPGAQLGTFTIRAIDRSGRPGVSSASILVLGDPAGPSGGVAT